MVLCEQEQIDTLRDKCSNAKRRIWIVSPYIGTLKDVRTIIDGKWVLPSVDCRIITDIKSGFIRKETFDEFIKNGVQIRNLDSVHAKIYIIDNWCLVTSANLTGTAFYSRYEMGIASSDTSDTKDVEKVFNQWWNLATEVKKYTAKPSKALVEYQDGARFKKKFKAKPYRAIIQDKYEAKCEKYKQFAEFYKNTTGRNQKMVSDGFTLLQEVDYFFNYLYRYHYNKPSKNIKVTRKASVSQKKKDVSKYFKEMCSYYNEEPQQWRLHRTGMIQTLLSPKKIDNLNMAKTKDVIMCLHCLCSYPINRTKFLKNNVISDIIFYWKELLHNGQITIDKINMVKGGLKHFGTSSINELIGWYYPDKYPIMNGISDCGMRYFGYDV